MPHHMKSDENRLIRESDIARVMEAMNIFLFFSFFVEESECEGCSPFASCQNGICVCLEQYTGNGYDCARKWLCSCMDVGR